MSGPPPKPDALKKLSGSKLPRNQKSPVFRNVDSVKPLKTVAKDALALEEWNRMLPDLVANGLLSFANLAIFGNYCLAAAEAEHAFNDVQDTGRFVLEPVFNKNGDHVNDRRKPNPSLAQAQHARMEMLRYAQEFGMTPASMTRVHADPGEGVSNDFDDFTIPPEEDEAPPAKSLAN